MAVVLEVSALNKYVRSLLESDEFLDDIVIRGEISNFNRNYKTGHCYFSLIDSKSSVKAVLFRREAERLSFGPENGQLVLARGRVSLYERDGAYQVYVDALFPDGAGQQKNDFEDLKEKLAKEGLFDPKHKKTLPSFPKTIGLITSKTGAALQDILQVMQRRNPSIRLQLAPVRVQGLGAAAEIARAVRCLDAMGPDLLIVARGGGSAEDLGAFNNEALARVVFAASTPVISAVGHEIDFTILDFVADLRAPTPSAAAELAVPDLRAYLQEKEILCMNMARNIHKRLDICYNNLDTQMHSPVFRYTAKRLTQAEEQVALSAFAAKEQMLQKFCKAQSKMQALLQLCESLNPYGVLARGYALVQKQGRYVGRTADLQPGDAVRLSLQDGTVHASVTKVLPKGEEAGQ